MDCGPLLFTFCWQLPFSQNTIHWLTNHELLQVDPHTPDNSTRELIADLLARPDGLTELLNKEALRVRCLQQRTQCGASGHSIQVLVHALS